MNHPLEPIFRPRSIAVVGASQNPTKRGYQAIKSLLEDKFEGSIFPVNPKEKEILGLPVYPDITSIDKEVDLALIATPAQSVPELISRCAKKEIKGAVVLAVGFGEMGVDGKRLQEEMVKIGRESNVRIVGPNTSGMFNLHHRLNLTGIRKIRNGSMAILSQSGNVALSLITRVNIKSKTGVGVYVGIGNEADIRFHEYLSYLKDDPNTNVVVIFVDGLRDGHKFLEVAKETVEKKPIVLLQSGRSEKGRKAAHTHTGALAGLSAVARSAFIRAGIITIEHSDELYPTAEALANLRPFHRSNIAVLSDGGGHASLAADALQDVGIHLPDLSNEVRMKLRTLLPANASVDNPIDVAGASDSHPGILADCAELLLEDKDIDGLMLVGMFGGYHIRFSDLLLNEENETARRLSRLAAQHNKPIVVQSLYASHRPEPLVILKDHQIPVHESVDVTSKCISVLDEYGKYLNTSKERTDFVIRSEGKRHPDALRVFERVSTENRKIMLETEARQVLALHDIPVTDFEFATSEEEAVIGAKKIGYPVVLKIISPEIIHKSDAGGVILNVKNDESVRDGFDLLIARARRYNQRAKIKGVLVAPMMPRGVEVVVGVTQDAQFGPVIMFGVGGVMVEVLKDVVFHVLPIGRVSSTSMVNEVRSHAILDGIRGNPPSDKEAIVDLIMQVSGFVEAYPDLIYEMDLNPIIVYERGLTVVDARIILK
jgi:acetate---CoA ligase (ADP-forming)